MKTKIKSKKWTPDFRQECSICGWFWPEIHERIVTLPQHGAWSARICPDCNATPGARLLRNTFAAISSRSDEVVKLERSLSEAQEKVRTLESKEKAETEESLQAKALLDGVRALAKALSPSVPIGFPGFLRGPFGY